MLAGDGRQRSGRHLVPLCNPIQFGRKDHELGLRERPGRLWSEGARTATLANLARSPARQEFARGDDKREQRDGDA